VEKPDTFSTNQYNENCVTNIKLFRKTRASTTKSSFRSIDLIVVTVAEDLYLIVANIGLQQLLLAVINAYILHFYLLLMRVVYDALVLDVKLNFSLIGKLDSSV